MKQQSGFTLIELLLVLAIIGIISAIALPALLGQRARARDKTSVQGTIGRIAEVVGQYDKAKEAVFNGDTSPVSTQMEAWLSTQLISTKDNNPWGAGGVVASDLIFSTANFDYTITGQTDKNGFDAALLTAAQAQTILGHRAG